MKIRPLFYFVLVLEFLRMQPPAAAAQTPEPEAGRAREESAGSGLVGRPLDVVVVPGDWLPGLLGTSIPQLRLMTRRWGRWEPVPFQIDEKTQDGAYLFPFGKESDREKLDQKLDRRDELVFLARDAGCRASAADWPVEQEIGEEIGLTDPLSGQRGWLYLFAFPNPPPVSIVDLINYDPDYDRIQSRYYTAGYSRLKHDQKAVMEYFSIPESEGGSGSNWCDSAKIWTRIKLLFSVFRITIHSDNWVSWVPAYIDGPIRVIVKKRMAIKLGLGLRTPHVEADLIYYPRFFISAIVISIPFDPSIVTSSLSITIGTDLNHEATGMLFWNSQNLEPVLVDGRMSPQEKAMDMRPDAWRVVSGRQGKYMGKAVYAGNFRLSNIKLDQGLYVDDSSYREPPENEPGIYGSYNWTWDITHGKKGKYVVWIEAHYGSGIQSEQDLTTCLNLTDHPLYVRTDSLERLNCLLIPPPGFSREVLPEEYQQSWPAH